MHECWRMLLRILIALCLSFVTVSSLRLYGEIGKRLEIPCNSADPLPGGTVTWVAHTKITPDNRRSFANRSLVINEYRSEDQAVYFCHVESESGLLYGDPVAVLTSEKRIIRFPSPSKSVKVGDNVRLSCPLTDWFPKPKIISWFKGDQDLPLSDVRFTSLPYGVLLISNVTLDDGGDYSCGVRLFGEDDELFTSQNSVTLNITEGEREFNILQSPPKSLSVELGQTIYLECFINSVNGEHVEWRKLVNGKWAALTASDDRVNVKENQFMLRMTFSHDDFSQAYQCVIMSEDNSTIALFESHVAIHSPPYSSSDSGKLIVEKVDQDFRARFDCAVDGVPSPERRWYKDGKEFPVCHNIQINADGSLQIDFASDSESGFYQCVAKNSYGMLVLSYRLDVNLAVDPLLKPLITSMQLTPQSSVEIQSQLCQPISTSTKPLALQFAFVENRCEPSIRTVQKIVSIENVDCTSCSSTSEALKCVCCVYTLELPAVRKVTEFIIMISRIDVAGFTKSDSKIIAVQPISAHLPDPSPLISTVSPLNIPESFEVEIKNFGTAILVQWNMITNATGYVVLISRHVGDTQATENIGKRDLNQHQNFTFIAGIGDRMTIGVVANSDTSPVFVQIQNISTSSEIRGYPAPAIAAIYPQGNAILLFWEWDKDLKVDEFEIVYICDIDQGIMTVANISTFVTIPGVDTFCDIMVGPIISGKPSTAAVTRFDRWCQTISPPRQVTITPKESYSSTALVVKWEADNVGCEINYRVKWKPAGQQQFADSDYVEVSNKLITNLSLMADVAYDIQMIAYTDSLANAVAGDVISYIAGVPGSPGNIKADTDSALGSAAIKWSHPNGIHDITLYLIRLRKKSKDGYWIDVQTLSVDSNTTSVKLKNLQLAATYNVTVNSINLFGSSSPTSMLFKLYPIQNNNGNSERKSLNETELGIIIGVAVGVVCLVTTIAVCIMFNRRFKNRPGSQAHQLTQRYPETLASLYMDNERDEQEMQERQPLQEISEDSSTLRDFGSPLQLSHRATSAQDSGIADDHRSSQDLGEYESHELLESPVSSDKMSLNSPGRWSCEMSTAIPDNCRQNGHNDSIPRIKQQIEDSICTTKHKQVPASIDSLVISV